MALSQYTEGYDEGFIPRVEEEAPAPPVEDAALRQVGWYPNGAEWVPYYRGADGQYYTADRQPLGEMPPAGFVDGLEKPSYAPGASGTPDPVSAPPPVGGGNIVPASAPGGGGTIGSYAGGGAIDPSYLAPWTERFKPPQDAALPTYQAPPEFSYQDFQAPEQFKPLTAADLLKDPSYLWREGRIRDTVQNSAAARGTLGSSGTLWDIAGAAGNLASQEYAGANDRAWQQWAGNFDASLEGYKTNRDNALSTYATNYGVDKDTYGLQTNRSQDVYDRAWKEFNDRRSTFFANQDRPADKLFRLADIGSRAAMA